MKRVSYAQTRTAAGFRAASREHAQADESSQAQQQQQQEQEEENATEEAHKAQNEYSTTLEGEEQVASTDSGVPMEEVEKLRSQLSEAEQKAKEKEELAKRMAAEVEDIRARAQRDKEHSQKFAVQAVAKDLLPVADNLQRALSSSNESNAYDASTLLTSLQDGVSMVDKMLLDALGKHGVSRFEPAVGDEFNPDVMEAMYQVPASASSLQPNTVVQVNKPGFYLHDRVLRAAEVGVAVDIE